MSEERNVIGLYHALLDTWNRRNAPEMAALFAEDGHIVGFDGSSHDGPERIAAEVGGIFAHHATPAYVGKVRGVRFLSSEVALVRAVAGMVPPGQSDLNPALNAIQTMVAAKFNGRWRVAAFQNTPAAFHGRPELADALTEELRAAMSKKDPESA
ncbi:MAG TPA: SgcJ/EcaC family oxidoreductase [candidate division Zixibacteria bacterium]|nr:SgcJ/EcaC family oxidoreductase [candidate division Zixibacteria bacterium]